MNSTPTIDIWEKSSGQMGPKIVKCVFFLGGDIYLFIYLFFVNPALKIANWILWFACLASPYFQN